MQLIETPQMAALRAAVEETLAGLQAQANGLRWQVASLQAQNRLLAGHASDLLESEGGRHTHWLVPLLYEAAGRICTDADDLKAAHAPDGDWTGEELAKVDYDRDIRLSVRLILATARLERGEI